MNQAPSFNALVPTAPLEEAHTRACQVVAELIAEYFIRHTPEAESLLRNAPLLRDPRLDGIVAAIRAGARIPCDCNPEYYTYLTELLIAAFPIRDFDIRRNVLHQYTHLLNEYALVNRFIAVWRANDREQVALTLSELHQQVQQTNGQIHSGLPITPVADAPPSPDPLFPFGPPPGAFGLIVGADGVGKGWFILDLLLSSVLARPLNIPMFQRAGPPLRVHYLCYEDDPRVLRWRLDRICESARCDPEQWRLAEREARLRFTADPGALFIQNAYGVPIPTETFHRLRETLQRTPTDLCIIDPLAAAALLQSENDNSSLNVVAVALRELARDTQCTILVTHHTSKAQRDSIDHHASRGASALTGAARWVLRLIADTKNSTTLNLAIPKNSYGRRITSITLRRLDKGVLREISGVALVKQNEALVDAVVRFVCDNPGLEINPNAVFRNCSKGAKALIQSVNASPKEAMEAVERALDQKRLRLKDR